MLGARLVGQEDDLFDELRLSELELIHRGTCDDCIALERHVGPLPRFSPHYTGLVSNKIAVGFFDLSVLNLAQKNLADLVLPQV